MIVAFFQMNLKKLVNLVSSLRSSNFIYADSCQNEKEKKNSMTLNIKLFCKNAKSGIRNKYPLKIIVLQKPNFLYVNTNI